MLMQIRVRAENQTGLWKECLDYARFHARTLEFEKATEICLEFLHGYLIPPAFSRGDKGTFNHINIVFTCGGNASRWDGFLGIPKQLIDTGDKLPLIQRSVNQFRSAFPGASCYVLVARHDDNRTISATGAITLRRSDNIHRPILVEILDCTEPRFSQRGDILVVYGDVYFSDAAITKIMDRIQMKPDAFTLFGRKRQNELFGNTGGEDFAVYAPRGSWQSISDYHALLQRLYIGTRLHRYGTWEMMTLLSLLTRSGSSEGIPRPTLINDDISQTIALMGEIWHRKEFDPQYWIDIDDETEDFDFPCEYIERLFRMVMWVGLAIEKHDTTSD